MSGYWGLNDAIFCVRFIISSYNDIYKKIRSVLFSFIILPIFVPAFYRLFLYLNILKSISSTIWIYNTQKEKIIYLDRVFRDQSNKKIEL